MIGSGFSGPVLANEIVKNPEYHIDIWEERNHAASGC
jgi:UDP-galactopyranose mutase